MTWGAILSAVREKGPADLRLALDQLDSFQRLFDFRRQQLIPLLIEVGRVVLELGLTFPEFVVPRPTLFGLDAVFGADPHKNTFVR